MGHRGMGVRVLVVDDNQDTAKSLAMLLEMEDFEAVAVLSADEALKVVDDLDPHVAIIDLGMPRVDGYALCRALRERVPDCRMVAFSGYPATRETQAAGFDLHVSKPEVPVDAILKLLEKPRPKTGT